MQLVVVGSLALIGALAYQHFTPEAPKFRTGYLEDEPVHAPAIPGGTISHEEQMLDEIRMRVRDIERNVAELQRPQVVLDGVTAQDVADAVWDDNRSQGGGVTAYSITADSIGASEIATDAISAAELATDSFPINNSIH